MSEFVAGGKEGAGRLSFFGSVLILAIAVVGAIFAIRAVVEQEKADDMRRWQDRLSIVADSRAADVSDWLGGHMSELQILARDASLQLYATLAISGYEENAEAQRGFIFNHLSAAAERSGFHESSSLDDIAANVDRPRRAGLALLRSDGSVLVATSGFPAGAHIDPKRHKMPFIQLGPTLGDRTPLALFASPVWGAGSTEGADALAWLVGARPLGSAFEAELVQPGAASESAESFVIAPAEAGGWQVISKLAKGGRRGDPVTNAAALAAAARPGGIVLDNGYSDTPVLATARELTGPTPWLLVHQIDASEAIAAAEARGRSLFLNLGLALLVVVVLLVLVARHATSQRERAAHARERRAANETRQLSHFLTRLSDSQPTALAAVGADGQIQFVNNRMAELLGDVKDQLRGRRLDAGFPFEIAARLRAGIEKAGDDPYEDILHMDGAAKQVMRTRFVPLQGAEEAKSALVVMEDITDLLREKQRSEGRLEQLVITLTRIIDARDPWSKFHSSRVADVASSIAQELELEENARNTVKIAGQLINLGKIFVPTDILTKTTKLSDEELELVRRSIARGAELVADLDFDGPVGAALAEMRAHWGGGGDPAELQGEDILLEARILAVANAFVGMVSARAHRAGLGLDKALDILNEDAGKRYERRIVAALLNIVENRGGRARWHDYTQPLEAAMEPGV